MADIKNAPSPGTSSGDEKPRFTSPAQADEALQFLRGSGGKDRDETHGTVDEILVDEKKLVRKIDFMIVPVCTLPLTYTGCPNLQKATIRRNSWIGADNSVFGNHS